MKNLPIKNIKNFAITFLVTFVFQTSYSQENFLPGYVINLNCDTIKGFIDYKNWGKTPKSVKFRKKNHSQPIVYKPTEIIEFNVNDEFYRGAIVEAEYSPTMTDKLQYNPALKINIDTTFLLTLFKGKKCLYFYKNGKGKENFYIKRDTIIELLIHKKFLKKYGGDHFIAENKKYVGQLTLYLNDCPSIQSKLQSTLYRKKSLIKLFKYYYECSGNDYVYKKKKEKTSIEVGVLAGVSASSIKFKSANLFVYLTNTDYNQSTNFTGGIFFDIVLPRNQGKWSINNEFIYTRYEFSGQCEESISIYKHSKIYTEIGCSYLKMNNLIRFKYPVGKLFIYLNAGMSNGIIIEEKNYKKTESKFFLNESISEGNALDKTRKHEQGIIIGLGAKYNKFSFEIRYDRGNGMSKYSNLNSTTTRYFFLSGYRF